MWDEFCVLYTDSKPDEISRGEVLIWNMKDAGMVLVFCRDIIHWQIKKCVFFVDEPVVMFQRNVFLTLEEEMKVSLTCLSMKYILPYLFQDLCEKTEEVLC